MDIDITKNGVIYLVRHGESMGNVKREVLPSEEDTLSEAGEEQVKRLGERLSDINFSLAFSSDLKRAVDTAEAVLRVSKHISPELKQDQRLRERFYGEFEGRSYQECCNQYNEDKVNGLATSIFDFETRKGEKISAVKDRMTSFLKVIQINSQPSFLDNDKNSLMIFCRCQGTLPSTVELCNLLDSVKEQQNVLIVSHCFALIALMHRLSSEETSPDFIISNWNHISDFKVMGNACYQIISVVKKSPQIPPPSSLSSPRMLNFISTFEGQHLRGMTNLKGSFSKFTKEHSGAAEFEGCTHQ